LETLLPPAENGAGNFFHEVYRIEHKLARAFATILPYPSYPLTACFGGVISRERLAMQLEEEDTEEFAELLAA
jgi:hypothetical protein